VNQLPTNLKHKGTSFDDGISNQGHMQIRRTGRCLSDYELTIATWPGVNSGRNARTLGINGKVLLSWVLPAASTTTAI
jgi:hypothetical protein